MKKDPPDTGAGGAGFQGHAPEVKVEPAKPDDTKKEPEQVDDRRTMYDFLGAQLTRLREDTRVGDYLEGDLILPARVVDTIQHMLYRIPSADRTVTRPFDAGDRHLLRAAINYRAEDLKKEAKRLSEKEYQGMADRLIADANALTDRLLPQFHEQRDLPLAPSENPPTEAQQTSLLDAATGPVLTPEPAGVGV